jgi:hypothetical protein
MMISDEAMTVHMRTYGVYTVGNVDIQHVTKFETCCAAPRDRSVCDYSYDRVMVHVTFGHCMPLIAGTPASMECPISLDSFDCEVMLIVAGQWWAEL